MKTQKNLIRKTKMIATIGPASENKAILKEMINSGVYAFRFNFSHGNHEEQLNKITIIRELQKELSIPLTTILDTKGPEIRTHEFDGKVEIKKGSLVKIYCDKEVLGNAQAFSVSFSHFAKDLHIESRVLVDDGKLTLKVEEIKDNVVYARAQNAHIITSRRGINLPNVVLSMDFLSTKDKEDLKFACKYQMDWIAASFVNFDKDVDSIRKLLDANGGSKIKICSKIESVFGIQNLKSIVKASDGIMVARGDLGIEIPFYEVPKQEILMILECLKADKPCVVATQMLESMAKNPIPTRAEVTDVYMASMLGAHSTMLSGESANGDYPILAVQKMIRILKQENCENLNSKLCNYHLQSQNEKAMQLVASCHKEEKKALVITKPNYKLVSQLVSQLDCPLVIVLDQNHHENYYGFTRCAYKLFLSENADLKVITKEMQRAYKITLNPDDIKIIC